MIAALVPAAGESRRMGRPKLLLDIDGRTLIARVVAALSAGGAAPVVVVPPPAIVPGAAEVAAEATRAGAVVVVPDAQPPDMRASVEIGLGVLELSALPIATVLLEPGDSPGLTPGLVGRVVAAAAARPDRIVVPTVAGKRGHPVALPWALARTITDLPPDLGVNTLLLQNPDRVEELPVDDLGAVADLDTPEDYRVWLDRGPGRPG
jgi:molybdenum cofactor cytidylyltransferase